MYWGFGTPGELMNLTPDARKEAWRNAQAAARKSVAFWLWLLVFAVAIFAGAELGSRLGNQRVGRWVGAALGGALWISGWNRATYRKLQR